jgi:hypothetical protein
MKQLLFLIALTCFSAITVRAQNSWIPKDVRTSTLLIEEFKYYDPNNTLTGVDEDYEDMKDDFLENTNAKLEEYNQKLGSILKNYKYSYELAMLSKLDERFADKQKYRYLLRREPYFGRKKVTNEGTQSKQDLSYCGYKYYFYDRVNNQSYPAYYYSGDQWTQLQRIVFWLNNNK